MNGVEKRTKNEGAESSTTHVPLNTSQSAISSHRKVIIVGAVSTGLALAHGLKKVGGPQLCQICLTNKTITL
ncbi:hypothetical protein N7501_007070 [Penicillium viridicatum]|nr:hypothetical protein N7501_007070 [Penicillium viridicatum]